MCVYCNVKRERNRSTLNDCVSRARLLSFNCSVATIEITNCLLKLLDLTHSPNSEDHLLNGAVEMLLSVCCFCFEVPNLEKE